MDYRRECDRWMSSGALTQEEKSELSALPDSEVRERFFAPLSFGTAGLRSVVGMGTARINRFTIAQAAQGLASALLSLGGDGAARGVAIAYDCRENSRELAELSASVLAANGIRAFVFDELRPTPLLSFTILRRRCAAGINITASHNPKEYNGYKVYWGDGAQLSDETAALVAGHIKKTDIFTGAKTVDFQSGISSGLIETLGAEEDEAFIAASLAERLSPGVFDGLDMKIVYTPFHGAGYKIVPEALRRAGLKNLICEPAQMVPDGAFPTVKSPNPEEKEGFALAIALAEAEGAYLIIGTDPDADRVGAVARRANGEYAVLTGNQTGALLTDYIITALKESGGLPEWPAFVTTVVTSKIAEAICKANGIRLEYSFTGFRFIAEVVDRLEKEGFSCLMGYEESFGYLIGKVCRDKDGVTASLLIAEMAAWHAKKGATLWEALDALYEKYGRFDDETVSLRMPGADGLAAMAALMEKLRSAPPEKIGGFAVASVTDYLSGEVRKGGRAERLPLSGSNVLSFGLFGGDFFIIRPSGTEPKIKIYMLTGPNAPGEGEKKLSALKKAAEELARRK